MSSAHQLNAPATSESMSPATNSETSFETSGPGNAAFQADAGLVCQDVPPDGGLDGPAQSWDAAAVDLWMQPDEEEEGDQELDRAGLLVGATFAVDRVRDGLIAGVSDWNASMQRSDPLPWYSKAMEDVVEGFQKTLSSAVVAALATVPGGLVFGFVVDQGLRGAAASLKSRLTAGLDLQDGDEMSEATLVSISKAMQDTVMDVSSAIESDVLKETDPKRLRAYAQAKDVPGAILTQAGLTAATNAWLAIAQTARTPDLDPNDVETPLADRSTVVDLTFSVGADGSIHFDGARMSGVPEALRRQLQNSRLGDLPFLARSTGRGTAGIVVEQSLAGMITDRSEPFAKPALVRIAERYGRVTANEGLWIVAEMLQRSTPADLGLKLEGAN